MLDRNSIKRNSILTHLEMLEMLRSRHQMWATERLDSEIMQTHYDIIDLIEQTSNKYNELLKLYGRKGG